MLDDEEFDDIFDNFSLDILQQTGNSEENPVKIKASELRDIPLMPMSEAVAVPFIQQQLPVPPKFEGSELQKIIAENKPVVVAFRADDDDDENLAFDTPDPVKGFSSVGIVGKVTRMDLNPQSGEMPYIHFNAGERVKLSNIHVGAGSVVRARAKEFPIDVNLDFSETEAFLAEIQPVFDRVLHLSDGTSSLPSMKSVMMEYSPVASFLFALFSGPLDPADRNEILSLKGLKEMMEAYLRELSKYEKFMIFRTELRHKVEKEMADSNRENFLQQEMNMIRDELGDFDFNDVENFRTRAKEKKWSEDTQRHFDRELVKLQRFPMNTPDYSIQSTYLDTFLNLPWQNYSEADFDFDRIAATLDRDHFGLEKVKERILEQMAVAKLRSDNKAPILCLVGPPGVGKTSLGRSIAEAMEREYVRVSFGGMHDEAEIRGHRRTYIGAMPGRLMASLTKCKTSNPVMVLDEIDKIGKDFKGDPSTALLEVLDPEQNSAFHDNYIDADYDFSNILFIATANSLDTISAPLLDRMEIISIPGYITAEKVEIAKQHLVPKELKANGFEENEIEFEQDALVYLTDYFTRESGVRRLEKVIAKVLRKLAVLKVRGREYPKSVTRELIGSLLGKEEYNPDIYESNEFIGVVTGLAWTSAGGEILFIEASVTEGKGKLTLTGNLGDVMKESATLALQYLRSHASALGIAPERFDKTDVHIHVPEGAIPKDGPSAGITMTTALASALTERKVRSRLAMTGEITLRGKVLPVGGIKEKIIAAKRAGITDLILSRQNEKDISEIQARYVDGLTFHYVDTVSEVLSLSLLS